MLEFTSYMHVAVSTKLTLKDCSRRSNLNLEDSTVKPFKNGTDVDRSYPQVLVTKLLTQTAGRPRDQFAP